METDPTCDSTINLLPDVLFRENEIEFLTRFIGHGSSLPYPSLHVYGHTATGKTYVVSKLLRKLNVPFVWIDCNEAFTSSILFTSIVRKLVDSSEDDQKVNHILEFVNFLKVQLKDAETTTYFVFDSAEVLRKDDPHLLTVLTRLQELTKTNICSIFISELPWRKLITSPITAITPISLHFPNFLKEQMMEILKQDCPEEHEADFYEGYINVILKTFHTVTTNLLELRHLARVNFEKYCEPLSEDCEPSIMQLYRNIEPTLKEAMSSVYLREISGSKWKTVCKDNIPGKMGALTISSNKSFATRELPFYSKFLLIAAYFASFNSPQTDFKNFVKNQGKQAKKRVTKKTVKNRHLLGPKPFSLDRLLSIFFSIVGERVLPSALIFSQISSLVNMRLMSRVSADEQLDCPKYKCLAELDLVSKIGKTVSIDVMGYLDDFIRNI